MKYHYERISKLFLDENKKLQWYDGTVTVIKGDECQIVYDDGDEEVMDESEVSEHHQYWLAREREEKLRALIEEEMQKQKQK